MRQVFRERRWPADERRAAAEERLMEAIFDSHRTPAVLFAERERARREAEWRRWYFPVGPRGR